METYKELQKELIDVCMFQEVDTNDIALYQDRIDKISDSLTDAQLDTLNRYIEELTLNWGDQS